jgi:hypothetical protein
MDKYKPDLSTLNRHWRRMLYSKIENIFEYEGLPEEINERALKLGLFLFGKLVFYKIGDKYLVQNFSYTDKLDWYYVPKNGRVVNPWLPIGHQNWEFEVDKECVIWNSTPDIYTFRNHSVVSDLVFKTATQLSENDMSYYCIQRNHRLIAIITAQDDKQKAEANRILEHMYNADPEMVMKEDLVNRIQVNPIAMNATRSPLTELIEFHQFILANFYHAFGINSNYNLKREQLNSNEITVNEDVMRLNIEDMLQSRQKGIEKINEIYGLNIRVSLNEEVYATLLAASELSEQGGLQEEVQNTEQTGFETTGEKDSASQENNSSVSNDDREDNRQRDSSEPTNENVSEKEMESPSETDKGTEEDAEEMQANDKSPEETDGDDGKEVSVTVIVNNGKIQNLGLDTNTEKGEDEDVALQDTETVGDREPDDKSV